LLDPALGDTRVLFSLLSGQCSRSFLPLRYNWNSCFFPSLMACDFASFRLFLSPVFWGCYWNLPLPVKNKFRIRFIAHAVPFGLFPSIVYHLPLSAHCSPPCPSTGAPAKWDLDAANRTLLNLFVPCPHPHRSGRNLPPILYVSPLRPTRCVVRLYGTAGTTPPFSSFICMGSFLL